MCTGPSEAGTPDKSAGHRERSQCYLVFYQEELKNYQRIEGHSHKVNLAILAAIGFFTVAALKGGFERTLSEHEWETLLGYGVFLAGYAVWGFFTAYDIRAHQEGALAYKAAMEEFFASGRWTSEKVRGPKCRILLKCIVLVTLLRVLMIAGALALSYFAVCHFVAPVSSAP